MADSNRVRVGLEVLRDDRAKELAGSRLGLIAHPASITRDLEHAVDVIWDHPDLDLVTLFGPQHGVRGEKQDNMIESAFERDPRTGLPVHSLYGEHRKPTAEMLDGVDLLLFDLQDVGVRIYTFIWTMTLAMQACREKGIPFVVLDRPNPIGGRREGTLLREGFTSFVGRHTILLRHGMTTGEIAKLVNDEMGIGCDLDVIAMHGWRRQMWYDETGLPYLFPSPNLPTLASCVVFPGMVMIEGTNLSEGRGTTKPFELVGAPYLEAEPLVAELRKHDLEGVRFRPAYFEPCFQKHARELCGGVEIFVTDRDRFSSVRMTLALLRAVRDLAPTEFAWRQPPYEYEEIKPAIDILWGGDDLRTAIDAGASPDDILAREGDEIATFENRIESHLLYE